MAAGRTTATAPQIGKCWHCDQSVHTVNGWTIYPSPIQQSFLHCHIPDMLSLQQSTLHCQIPDESPAVNSTEHSQIWDFFSTSGLLYSTLLNMGYPHQPPALHCHILNYILPQAVYLYSQILDYIPSPVVNSKMSNAADISTLSNS